MTFTLKFRVRLLLIAVRSSLHENHIILVSKAPLIVYKASKSTGVKNIEFISFTLLEGTYSNDDFNAKIKVGILQERLNI